MSEPAPLLEVDDLTVVFPGRRTMLSRQVTADVRAVDGVSLRVDRGEMLAVVGESGCGKTTTLQAILGMVPTATGSVRINGQEVIGRTAKQMRPMRRHAQMIYQDPYEALDTRFRVWQTIEEPLLVHRIGGTRAARSDLIRSSLERAELSPASAYADRYPHELSGGQRQRVAIAASLVLEPDLLLADEPVSMLDVSVRAGVLSLLDGLRTDGRMGIVMITHDLSTAAHFADRIAVMYLGRIVEEGTAREVIHEPRHPYTKALLSIVPRPDPRDRSWGQILTGEAPNPADIPSGCRFHPRCPVAVETCQVHDPSLAAQKDSRGHQVACLLTAADGPRGERHPDQG
jgi:oligopeptide/dipeptide ABC transporter ATP-binding protein